MMKQLLQASNNCATVSSQISSTMKGLPRQIGQLGNYLVEGISDLTSFESTGPKLLGEGNFGIVYESTFGSAGNKRLAARKITFSKENGASLIKEMELQRKLSSPHIVQVFDGGAVADTGGYSLTESATMTSEFAGNDLEKVMGAPSLQDGKLVKHNRLSPKLCENVKEGLLYALDEMNYHGLVHRDIKPDNVFMDQAGLVKLGDFGLARSEVNQVIKDEDTAMAGYTAPEVITGQPHTHASDIFSVGAVLFKAHSGRALFPEGLIDKHPSLMMNEGLYIQYLSTMITNNIEDTETALMLCDMLAFNPEARPSTSDLLYSDAKNNIDLLNG